MLGSREINKAKEREPKTWPWSVIVYALFPDDNTWLSQAQLHRACEQFCEHIGRKPMSKRMMSKTVNRMCKRGWLDVDQRDEGRPGPKERVYKRRDMDWWGNLVWPQPEWRLHENDHESG